MEMTEDQTISQIIEDAIKRLKAQEAEVLTRGRELQTEKDDLQKRKAELDTLEERLREKEDGLRQKESSLGTKEGEVRGREEAAQTRAAKLDAREAEVSKMGDRVKAAIEAGKHVFIEKPAAVRTGPVMCLQSRLLLAVWAFSALVDKAHVFQGVISGLCPPQQPEVKPGEMLPGITDERFDTTVVLHRFPDNKPEEDPEAHLGVVLGIHRHRPVAPDTCPEVCPAEWCSICCCNKEKPAAPADSSIDKHCRCPERVKVNRIERLFGEEGIDISLHDGNRKTTVVFILRNQPDGGRVTVTDCHRNIAFFGNPHAPDTGSSHGIEIIGRFQEREEEDGCVAVQFHPGVEENGYGTGRELC